MIQLVCLKPIVPKYSFSLKPCLVTVVWLRKSAHRFNSTYSLLKSHNLVFNLISQFIRKLFILFRARPFHPRTPYNLYSMIVQCNLCSSCKMFQHTFLGPEQVKSLELLWHESRVVEGFSFSRFCPKERNFD